MMRCLLGSLLVLLGVLNSVSSVGAEEFQLVKVYRDYPGYISPPACENPRMGSPAPEHALHAGGSDKQRLFPAARFYLGGWLGMSTQQSDDLDAENFDPSIDYEPGYALGLLGGYDFGILRLELEGGLRHLDIDKAGGGSSGSRVTDGDIEIISALFNVYADIPTGTYITPYVGAGIGYASVDFQDVKTSGSARVDDSDDVLCGQAAAGFDFMLNAVTTLDVGYRFLITEDPEFTDDSGGKVDTELMSHTVIVGLKFLF